MKNKNKFLQLIIAVLLIIATCTSCITDKSDTDAHEQIERVVNHFFSSIQSGQRVDTEWLSDFDGEDLSFIEDSAHSLYLLGMSSMIYEILDISYDAVLSKGSCEVEVVVIDIERILGELGSEYSEDDLFAHFNLNEVVKKAYLLCLDLIYDKEEDSWNITDSYEVFKALKLPYTQIVYKKDEPEVVAAMFMDALIRADFDLVCELSADHYYEGDFIDFRFEESEKLFQYVFGNMSFEIESINVSEGQANVFVRAQYPDFIGAYVDISKDVEYLAEVAQDYMCRYFRDDYVIFDDIRFEFDPYMSRVVERIYSDLKESGQNTDNVIEIVLFLDSHTQTWYVESITDYLTYLGDITYKYDPIDIIPSNLLQGFFEQTIENLYEEGMISRLEYEAFMEEYAQIRVDSTIVSYSADEIIDRISSIRWYDWTIMDYVQDYNSSVSRLNIDLGFREYLPGLRLECDFYLANEDNFLGTDLQLMHSERYNYFEFIYDNPSGLPFEAGTYLAVIRTIDGEIIAESTIVIS